MEHDLLRAAEAMPDAALTRHLQGLAARGRATTAELVAHLAVFEARGLDADAGYPSLFEYCCVVLRLSEGEAYNRVVAARTARRFPVVLELLGSGALNLTTVRLLSKHLTDANHRPLLEAARGKRRREVEAMVAALAPRPDVPTTLRRLPETRGDASSRPPVLVTPAASAATDGPSLRAPEAPSPALASPTGPEPGPPTSARAGVAPLSPGRFRYQVTLGADVVELMQVAKDLLSHAVPVWDDAALLARAFEALVLDLARQRFAESDRPRDGRATAADSRHVPAAVKRAVFVRDRGRCTYTGPDGHRCDERRWVEFHHLKPYVAGGPPTVDNLHLRCHRHNQHEARVYFAASRGPGSPSRDG